MQHQAQHPALEELLHLQQLTGSSWVQGCKSYGPPPRQTWELRCLARRPLQLQPVRFLSERCYHQ
jgi:hypothetical protein